MKFEIKLPPEFISGNEIPVSVATIKRERMEEILKEVVQFTLQQEVSDRGPWQVGRNKSDGRIFIQSEDFEYDVRLYIDGNFGCDDLKTEYAENICQKLNLKENK